MPNFNFHPAEFSLRTRVLTAYRNAGWIMLSSIAFIGTIAVVHSKFPEVLSIQTIAIVVLVMWGAYLGGSLASARAHPASRATIVEVGQALGVVAAELESMHNTIDKLIDYDSTDRAAATSVLMQAKGSVALMREIENRRGGAQVGPGSILGELTAVDGFITDAIEDLSAVRWENADQAVDEAASAVKH